MMASSLKVPQEQSFSLGSLPSTALHNIVNNFRGDYISLRTLRLVDRQFRTLVYDSIHTLEFKPSTDPACWIHRLELLPSLKKLSLDGMELTKTQVEQLCGATWALEELSLASDGLSDGTALAAFVESSSASSWASSLRVLDLSRNRTAHEGTCRAYTRARWPKLQVLRLNCDAVDELCEALSAAFLPSLRELDLMSFSDLSPSAIEFLVRAKWPQLTRLGLAFIGLTEACLNLILEAAAWPELEVLNISSHKIDTNDGMGVLVRMAAAFPNLRVFNGGGNGILLAGPGDEAVPPAAFPSLEELDLSHSDIEDDNIDDLRRVQLPCLKSLRLRGNAVRSLASLAAAPWPFLTHLDLSETSVNDVGIENLAGPQQQWSRLENLNLSHTMVGPAGGAALARASKLWPRLRVLSFCDAEPTTLEAALKGDWNCLEELHLASDPLYFSLAIGANPVIPACGKELAACASYLPNLTLLDLSGIRMDNGLQKMFRSPWMALKELRLCDAKIGVTGAQSLAFAAYKGLLPALTRLQLNRNVQFDSAAVRKLMQYPWPSLVDLNLEGCRIFDEGVRALVAASFERLPALRLLKISCFAPSITAAGVRTFFEGRWKGTVEFSYSYAGTKKPSVGLIVERERLHLDEFSQQYGVMAAIEECRKEHPRLAVYYS